MGSGNKKTDGSNPTQVTVVLRLIAGGYLVYLAFGLLKEYLKPQGGGALYQLGFTALFFAIGAFLAGWSIMKFVKGEYVRYGESTDSGAEENISSDDDSQSQD